MWPTSIFSFALALVAKSFSQLSYIFLSYWCADWNSISTHTVPSVNLQRNYEVFVLQDAPSPEWSLNYVLFLQNPPLTGSQKRSWPHGQTSMYTVSFDVTCPGLQASFSPGASWHAVPEPLYLPKTQHWLRSHSELSLQSAAEGTADHSTAHSAANRSTVICRIFFLYICSSSASIYYVKIESMGWTVYESGMKNAYKIFIWKPEGKNIKIVT